MTSQGIGNVREKSENFTLAQGNIGQLLAEVKSRDISVLL